MATFVDRVVLHVAAGAGGNGCASVLREKFRPLGGPDGGNGGRGGDIVLKVDTNVTTLLDFHFRPHVTASAGKPGQGDNKNGSDGDDTFLAVPPGTVVMDGDGNVLADMLGQGSTFVVAEGGIGGKGNAALAGPRRKAPGFALLGTSGDARDVTLELKSVADVGLIGYPSAGKSSLVSVLSAARPKIADYPFTTLQPVLGVVQQDGFIFTVADVPGLIPGASQGKGLGLEFLRHVERCAVLVHVLDCGTLEQDRDPIHDLEVIENELALYGGGLTDRPRLIALNKTDLPDGDAMADLVEATLQKRGLRTFRISAVTHAGLVPLTRALATLVAEHRAAQPEPGAARVVLRPTQLRQKEFDVIAHPDGSFEVTGSKTRRWVEQTLFSNDEAVGFLGDRLARLGVEEALAKAGAHPGDEVVIGDVSFEWEPTTLAGIAPNQGPRGTDLRIDTRVRLSRAERIASDELEAELDEDPTLVSWATADGSYVDITTTPLGDV